MLPQALPNQESVWGLKPELVTGSMSIPMYTVYSVYDAECRIYIYIVFMLYIYIYTVYIYNHNLFGTACISFVTSTYIFQMLPFGGFSVRNTLSRIVGFGHRILMAQRAEVCHETEEQTYFFTVVLGVVFFGHSLTVYHQWLMNLLDL